MNIYKIGANGYWTGEIDVILSGQGAPTSWTRTVVPTLQTGEYAQWLGQWTITTVIPVVVARVADTAGQDQEISIIDVAARLVQTQRIMAQMATRGQTQ